MWLISAYSSTCLSYYVLAPLIRTFLNVRRPFCKSTRYYRKVSTLKGVHVKHDYITLLSFFLPALQVLIPKLKEPDHNPNVVINIMAAIGELAQVAQTDMKYSVDELCPIIMDMLQDSSSLTKREVALWTFGQLVENTG